MGKQKIIRLTLNDGLSQSFDVPDGWRVLSMVACANETARCVYVLIEQMTVEPQRL